jgi:hypothetical protein
MATFHKALPTGMHEPKKSAASKNQLRKDRAKGIVIVMLLAALMALMIWLASLGSGTSENIQEFWPMMP